MNERFSRSTRETAFSLALSYNQIAVLVHVWREHRGGPLDVDVEPEPMFGWAYHRGSINALWEKGLVCKRRHTAVPTTAGLLVLQLLRESGHLQQHTTKEVAVTIR